MKVREFLKQAIDIDIYDDTVEELGIAFCGPQQLTDAGEKYFQRILDHEVDIFTQCAIVHLPDIGWESDLMLLKELFEGAAGYIDSDKYRMLFEG